MLRYDSKNELRGEFETLMLPEFELIELANKEFTVKHRILREQPDKKILIYHAGPKPGVKQIHAFLLY